MTIRVCATAAVPSGMSLEGRTRVARALSRLGGSVNELTRSHATVHQEGSVGAGDLTWDFEFGDNAASAGFEARVSADGWAAAFEAMDSADRELLIGLSELEAWRIEVLDSHVETSGLVGVKRTNLVRVRDTADSSEVERWGRAVTALPNHVPAIRNWCFSRVRAFGPASPRVGWTHSWEQEFETLEGLVMDYMMSPYHWGWLDGFYDPEMPQSLIEPELAHLYGFASESVLGWAGS